jgi:hypothetical protein
LSPSSLEIDSLLVISIGIDEIGIELPTVAVVPPDDILEGLELVFLDIKHFELSR